MSGVDASDNYEMTTVEGNDLTWWQICYDALPDNKKTDLERYRVTIINKPDTVEIFLKKKESGMMLGGGHGRCVIDRSSKKVLELYFSR